MIHLVALLALPVAAFADDPIGQIKTQAGTVQIERAGKRLDARVGDHLFRSDVLTTGARSTVGVTFADNSLLALGAFSRLSLDIFKFNTTTHEGAFDVTLKKGALAVKSGQIVKQSPEAMRVRTPVAVLGVRGTQFAVRADGDKAP